MWAQIRSSSSRARSGGTVPSISSVANRASAGSRPSPSRKRIAGRPPPFPAAGAASRTRQGKALRRAARAGRVVVGRLADRRAALEAADMLGHQLDVVGPRVERGDPEALPVGPIELVVVVEADVRDPLGPEDPVEAGHEGRLAGAAVAAADRQR